MNSKSINEIILSNIHSQVGQPIQNGYNADHSPNLESFDKHSKVHINIVINKTISEIDSCIRFTLKTYFENYYCILERKLGKGNAGANWAIFMEHGTCKTALIEIQKLGIPRHLSNILLLDFGSCCTFDDNGELVSLDVSAIVQKIAKQNSAKYAELHQSLIENYLIPDDK